MNHRSSRKVPKSKILKAALALFSLRGYTETKMIDIARSAGMSVGALYLRFHSKEELCMELINEQRKGFDELTIAIPLENDPLKALKSYIALHLDYALKRKQLISMILREHKLPFLKPMRKNFFADQQKIIRAILRRGVKQGVFRRVNYDQTSLIIFSSIRGAILFKLSFEIGSVQMLKDSLFDLICTGIRKDVS